MCDTCIENLLLFLIPYHNLQFAPGPNLTIGTK